MGLSSRELWTIIHGMVLGGFLLLSFSGVLVGLWGLHSIGLDGPSRSRHLRTLSLGIWALTILAWLTVISGTYLSYPWFRAVPPSPADLSRYPQALLLADPHLAFWEDYGMEWKEHFGWFAPILMTTVSFLMARYKKNLVEEPRIFRAAMVFLAIAFVASIIGGLVGALVTRVAPVR